MCGRCEVVDPIHIHAIQISTSRQLPISSVRSRKSGRRRGRKAGEGGRDAPLADVVGDVVADRGGIVTDDETCTIEQDGEGDNRSVDKWVYTTPYGEKPTHNDTLTTAAAH